MTSDRIAQMLLCPRIWKSFGTMPITVKSVPSRRSSRPTMPGSALKRVRQNASLITTRVGAGGLVLGGERPAGNRCDAEDVENPGRDPLAGNRLRVAIGAGHHHAADARRKARDVLERAAARLPVEQVERRGVALRNGRGLLPDRHEAIGVAVRKRAEERGIDEREDGAVGADAERERQRRHQGEGGRALQLPDREPEVAPKLVEPLREAHVAVSPSANCRHRLSEARDIAEPPEGQLSRRRRIHAARDELARAHLDVQGELLVDLALERHTPQPRTERALHVDSRTLETPVVNRRQVASSVASCSRPNSVRRYSFARRPELGHAPFGFDPPPPLQPVQRRIEGPVLDEQGIAGGLLDEAGDGVPVARTSG